MAKPKAPMAPARPAATRPVGRATAPLPDPDAAVAADPELPDAPDPDVPVAAAPEPVAPAAVLAPFVAAVQAAGPAAKPLVN